MSTALERRVKLHQTQADFCRSDALYKGLVGGRGSGKTHAGAYDLIRRGRPGCVCLVGSPTAVLMHDVTYPKFRALARDLGVWDDRSVRLTPYPTLTLLTGVEVRFRTAEDPDKMRGPDLDHVWLDEASLMRRDAYDVCLGSLRHGGRRGRLTATFTPKGRSHWTYDVFGTGARPDVAIFHCTSHDNPFLPPGFAVGLTQQYSGLRALQEVGGQFCDVEGAEWPGDYFGESIWFTDWPKPDTILRSILAIDGSKGKLTGDYQALVLLRLDKQGHFWIDCEAHRLDEVQLLAKSLELIDRWQPDCTVVESNGAGYYLLNQLSRSSVNGLRPAVVGRHHGSEAGKQVRITTRLTSQWARGTIHLRRGSPGCRMLEGQARDWPEGVFDDLLDALETGMELHGQLVLPRDRRTVPYEIPRR